MRSAGFWFNFGGLEARRVVIRSVRNPSQPFATIRGWVEAVKIEEELQKTAGPQPEKGETKAGRSVEHPRA